MTIIRWRNRPVFSGMLENMLQNDFNTGFERNSGHSPATNILEKEDAFLIELAAPGKTKEAFQLKMENNILSVSYERKKAQEENTNETYLFREFDLDSFTRSFSVPKTADMENIKARYENGILTISIPKLNPEKTRISRQIEVA
jgi:HSP20 family protein